MTVLVTGGAGYIGSHTCVELLNAGYDVAVVDNLSNAKYEAIRRVEEITGAKIRFYETDCCNYDALSRVFAEETHTEAVIHFAGFKAVGESVQKPVMYYRNNLLSTLNVIQCMDEAGVGNMVFSSSATVYGDPAQIPITEDCPKGHCTNPYGQTKSMIEQILSDLCVSDPKWHVMLLRYFNPVGAHESGRIGEDPKGIPNNLMPYISQVAVGRLDHLNVFGDDYDTPDGTGVRDYIHVVDLADGHVKALEHIGDNPGVSVYNLGTGRGYSVLDLVHAFGRACGHEIPYRIAQRRAGDIAQCYSDPSKANKELGWRARHTLDDMCADAWRWQSANPEGY